MFKRRLHYNPAIHYDAVLCVLVHATQLQYVHAHNITIHYQSKTSHFSVIIWNQNNVILIQPLSSETRLAHHPCAAHWHDTPQISERLTLTESRIRIGMSTMQTPTLLLLILILATEIHCPATRSYLKYRNWYRFM